ncbi:hypothetical protein [Marinobacter sp. NFXS9]|uniref:cytidine deaminase-like fold-containing protein n=1 Tax=Marinobacter sp. NFXS9 TaxID=2818433 RepID=UPI0032DE69F8
MSYALYVTGGYGFTETILPRLLYPSNAVDVARDYFTRGYQGHHIDLPPDADFSQSGNLTDTQKRKLLDDLQDGRLVLASRYGPGFELFTESEASPDLLRSDLPPALRHRLQQHWPTGARGAFARSDSLAPAVEPANPAPEPPVAETPLPGSGPYHVKLAYHWPDGTGVANLPFILSTDQETVKGTLDAHGEAQIQGLNGRFATIRLSSDASDGDVSQQRRGIQAALEGLLNQERKEAEDLAREYEQLPWYRRGLVSIGAVSQGFSDAGMGLIRFVAGVSDLSSPTQTILDGLKSAWAASEGSPDEHWFESYQANYEEARHRRWVEDLGFDPSDISREDIAEAYDLANLVMADPELRQSFTDFAADYAAIQHHTEVSYFTGAVAFDVILTAILAVATGGVGAAGAAGTQIRHAGRLTHLGKTVKAFGKAVRKQRLRRIWRDADLNSQTVLEDTAPSRVDGLELKAADAVPNAAKPVVTAEARVNGSVFGDVNQTARAGANVDQPTLIAERIAEKSAQSGKVLPNGNMGTAHAEVGAIQQAFDAGATSGADMTLTVTGKAVCGFCRGDIAAMAKQAELKSLTVYEEATGNTLYWQPGMKSVKKAK